jgi:hypothetical protein
VLDGRMGLSGVCVGGACSGPKKKWLRVSTKGTHSCFWGLAWGESSRLQSLPDGRPQSGALPQKENSHALHFACVTTGG